MSIFDDFVADYGGWPMPPEPKMLREAILDHAVLDSNGNLVARTTSERWEIEQRLQIARERLDREHWRR